MFKKRILLLGIVYLFLAQLEAQVTPRMQKVDDDFNQRKDSIFQNKEQKNKPNDSLEVFNPTISDYKYGYEDEVNQILDTALTIERFYKQNFLQKDLFGLMPFPNVGQTFTELEPQYQNNKLQLIPKGKSYNLVGEESVKYYDVKTPTTEFFYENGVKEGQSLSTTFTHSPNQQWNYSVNYRGLRSEGRYNRQLAANRQFLASLRHQSKNKRYKVWTHYATQNIDNQENAGVDSLGLASFKNNDEDYNDRRRIDVNLNDATSYWDERRFYLGQSFGVIKKRNPADSTQYEYPISIRNILSHKKQTYQYKEDTNEDYFESSIFEGANRKSTKELTNFTNTATAVLNLSNKLWVEGGVRYTQMKLNSDSAITVNSIYVPKKIDDKRFGLVGKVKFKWKETISVYADAAYDKGDLFADAYTLNGQLFFSPLKDYQVKAGIELSSQIPSINLIYNQSFYEDYNYYNPNFENEDIQRLFGEITLNQFDTNLYAEFSNIQNYTYVDANYKPTQLDEGMSYFKVGVKNHFGYKNFHLNTRLQYQKVTQNEFAKPLPDFIGRLTVYYQNKVFKGAGEVQTGINVNYFSAYEAPEFFPVTNEFKLQNESNKQEIGNYPMLDLFLNFKVRRMRVYLRGENMNSIFQKGDYFSTPHQPFRDFKVQFGIHWFLFT